MVIQRSWKILSEPASASTTDANRSPAGLHSSSDDSNCSNQTTHSMVTSVASPPTGKFDGVASMANENKFVTTPQMAENMLKRLRQRLSCPGATSSSNAESAVRSLELLRISVQNAFDKEIDGIVKRFIENYFKPACNNIKSNMGQNSLSDDVLQKMSCALLENSKAQYNAFRVKQPVALSNTQAATPDQTMRMTLKRPAAKPIGLNELSKKLLPTTVTVTTQLQAAAATTTTATNRAPPVQTQPTRVPAKPVTVTPARRQIFWNTAHISTATKFVLDVQANQAFGFGTDGKERLASKHPELIRYLPDGEDREWLTSQNIISQQNRNSRFLFLIHDEVCRLQQTNDVYRNKPNVNLNCMHKFTVPEFMIQKMKIFFVDLNIKSRGLITNSFSVGTMQSNSHLRNALLQGVNNNTTGTTETIPNNANVSSLSATLPIVANDNATVDVQLQVKPKASTLSSSHATLTALLNNAISSSSLLSSNEDLAANKLHK
ncbi:deoxynucleotidyltransferase terminal-interacting protein 1 isoform X2 [Teleopsis dalmanni]|uniref:deoxynucleotidyltransferase terminal-interacting protein 1 isoform X2 n=1 Tax=Teleopsis dalmanni TaxID=139649 RepID=UPI0018CECCF6|nr:deoxynucleotidyltransferase terminal-interacting protein 1 isoform X2 [Teleopsis dalmanni]